MQSDAILRYVRGVREPNAFGSGGDGLGNVRARAMALTFRGGYPWIWSMPDLRITAGSCLCGRVRFEIRGSALRFAYCHCKSCRKSSGSAHVSNIGLPKENLRWLAGEELIQVFTDELENPGFRRAFCRQCGCAVPKLSRNGQMYVVQAGLLDGDPGIRPDAVIWWDEHAPWLKNLDALDKLGEGVGSAVREPARPGFTGEY